MVPCSRCRPACRPAGSSRSPPARWRSASPASRSCRRRRRSTPRGARSSTAPWSWPTRTRRRSGCPSCSADASHRRARSTSSSRTSSACTSTTTRQQTFDEECRALIETYLTWRIPAQIHPIGLELRLSADVGSLSLRGIIDRLELRDGELVVTDYKTGRAPSINWEQRSLAGVHFYSFLCEQVFGRRPASSG